MKTGGGEAAGGEAPHPQSFLPSHREGAGGPSDYPVPRVHTQGWRRLLFLHWPVPLAQLQPLVPAPLEVDLFEGQAYVSLAAFAVEDFRLGPLRLRFLETNVRTYVHLGGREHGLYFFSLDAASQLAVLGARALLGLPYFFARMREDQRGYRVQRLRGPSLDLAYAVGEPLGPAAPGTLDHFLLERYVLHAPRGPSVWTVRVHHRPYPRQAARLLRLDDRLVAAAGLRPAPTSPLVHYAAGVDVRVDLPRVRRR